MPNALEVETYGPRKWLQILFSSFSFLLSAVYFVSLDVTLLVLLRSRSWHLSHSLVTRLSQIQCRHDRCFIELFRMILLESEGEEWAEEHSWWQSLCHREDGKVCIQVSGKHSLPDTPVCTKQKWCKHTANKKTERHTRQEQEDCHQKRERQETDGSRDIWKCACSDAQALDRQQTD